ncbi:hypothetical protein KPH14_007371 [Odynerus spinipes]|uniref:Uncharacterized protein n=1 Tax=Odynerus spinipes TaxID=1348599 RepID=A0AAD9VIN5_9HYME|nr:hypothetical protein KPH14_007371 [Odynerus spinipes]
MSTTSQESKITGAGESKDSDQKHEEIIPTLKREHDSTDDFERVEPENLFASETSSSKKEEEEAVLVKEEEKKKQKEGATEQQGPRSQEDNRPAFSMDSRVVHAEQVPPRTERSLLDEGLEGLGEREEKAVPATPPPSADLEKYNSMADPFQQQPAGKNAASADQIDPRAATVAFVETERAAAAAIQAQNVAPANGAAAPGENTLLLDLSKSHDKDKVITSTKKNNDDDDDDDDNDEARMSAALDSSTKEVSSNLLDFDSFESKPSVPATKVEPEIVDLLSTSNHEILARGDENVTKNDRNLGMGDRSSDHEFVDVRTTAKKEQNDVNVKDTLVGGEPTTKRKEQTAEKTMNSEVKPDSKATSGRTSASSVPQNTGSKDTRYPGKSVEKIQEIEIAPKEIFTDMGLGELI